MDNLFYMEVSRCKRCGGILISEDSKKRGYGESCYRKMTKEKEANKPYPGQMNITDFLK